MTLLITVIAAIISTIIWYNAKNNNMHIGTLALMFWGASLMWFVDAMVEYWEIGADYFTPAIGDMINDAYLGVSVVALGCIIWLVTILLKDPNGKIKEALTKK